jgi:SnoaL-like domain
MKIQSIAFATILGLLTIGGCKEGDKSTHTDQSIQLLKDELEIRALAEKFSDAANRKDGALFQSLWAKEAVWKIGPPINVEFKGKENMGTSVTHMLGLWDFFVQLSGPGVVTVNGDKATARFYVNEIARKTDDKSGNYNLSLYEDELIKEDGKWVFLKRRYHTIYQEAPEYKGIIQSLPPIK